MNEVAPWLVDRDSSEDVGHASGDLAWLQGAEAAAGQVDILEGDKLDHILELDFVGSACGIRIQPYDVVRVMWILAKTDASMSYRC